MSSVAASASAASSGVPRCPTIAVSVEQVERLGGQRAERGDREPQDLAVVRAPQHARQSTIGRMRRRASRCSCSPPLLGRRLRRATSVPPVAGSCTGEPGDGRRARSRRRPARSTLADGTTISDVRRAHARSDARAAERRRHALRRRRGPRGARAGRRRGRRAAARLPRRRGATRARERRAASRPSSCAGSSARPASTAPRPSTTRSSRALRGRGAARVRLRLFHAPDGARVAYREAGTGPPLVLLHSLLLSPPRVRAGRRATSRDRFRARPARPAAARRLGGPPAPPVHARLARRRHERVRPRDVRAARRSSAATRRARRSSCTRSRAGGCARRGSCCMPNRLHTRRPAPARCARRWRPLARLGGVPGPRPRRRAHARGTSSRPSLGAAAVGAATPPRATSSATRSPTSPATRTSCARGRRLARGWPRDAQRELLDAYARHRRARAAAVGRRGPAASAARRRGGARPLPRRAAARAAAARASSSAYDDPVGLARELAAFCG